MYLTSAQNPNTSYGTDNDILKPTKLRGEVRIKKTLLAIYGLCFFSLGAATMFLVEEKSATDMYGALRAEVKAATVGKSAVPPQGLDISYPYGDGATPNTAYMKKFFSGHTTP
jgi:hypothetical protein